MVLTRLVSVLKEVTPACVKSRIAQLTPAHRVKRRQRQMMIAFYGHFMGPGDICLDVGANFGERTDVFLRLGTKVIAVEPQPVCVAELLRMFGRDPRVVVVQKGLGAREGTAEMAISSTTVLSSMSREWIERVTESGRFRNHHWNTRMTVSMTTLDDLIGEFGVPAFIKIDVEGFEYEVLRGLHQPVRAVSFEFVAERLGPALECVAHLDALGVARFNYSLGESMTFASPEWVGAGRISDILQALPDKLAWGDVYARSELGGRS